MDRNYLSFKVIIVGHQGVGKTALAFNYVKGQFKQDYNVTVGVEFSSKTIDIEDTSIQMQIWDTVARRLFCRLVWKPSAPWSELSTKEPVQCC